MLETLFQLYACQAYSYLAFTGFYDVNCSLLQAHTRMSYTRTYALLVAAGIVNILAIQERKCGSLLLAKGLLSCLFRSGWTEVNVTLKIFDK